MKKEYAIAIIIILVIVAMPFVLIKITGKVVGGPEGAGGEDVGGFRGPSEENMACMVECTTRECDVSDMDCRVTKSSACGNECGVDTEQPEPADEGEVCMQECIIIGCTEFDFSCQRLNQNKCDDECDMKGDAPDESEMSAEELCIINCVAEVDPMIRCGSSQEGETGGEICQRCAASCVHLYEGPCLDDEGLIEKEKACETCEHCYGEPIMGPSGQGWDCIVDVECLDASTEFGDDPGEGDDSFEEGHEEPGIVFEEIGNFFKGLFGGE